MTSALRNLAAGAAASALAATAFAGTGLVFTPGECDFGELGPVETAERTVEVRNAGPVPVKIVRVRACCGAKASMEVRELQPSSSAELRVSVTTGVGPGPFRKTVTVLSDDPARPMFSLPLAGRVRETRSAAAGDEGNASVPSRARVSKALPAATAGNDAGSRLCAFAVVISLAWLFAVAFMAVKRMFRNAVPAMVALGAAFALVGWALWPRQRDVAPPADRERPGAAPAAAPAAASASGAAAKPSAGRGGRPAKMSDAELADGNERLEEFLRAPTVDPAFPALLASVVADRTRDEQWRNHCLQFVPDCMVRLEGGSPAREALAATLASALSERSGVLAGTALLGYSRLSEWTGSPTGDEVGAMAVAIAADASSARENVVTALRVGAEKRSAGMLAPARYWARNGEGEFLRCVAISAVRDLGGPEDAALLRSLLPGRTKAEESMLKESIKKIEEAR